MKLTDKLKREIDAIPYEGLLKRFTHLDKDK